MARANGFSRNGHSGLVDQHGAPLRRSDYDDGFPLPHVLTFNSMLGGAWKKYYNGRFDEAMRHSREDALAMRRDCFNMGLLQERQLGTSSLKWHIDTDDDRDPEHKQVKEHLTAVIKRTPYLQQVLINLLEAVWYGRYGVQLANEWQQVNGIKSLVARDHLPVNGDKIGHDYDHTPWIHVYGAAGKDDIRGGALEYASSAFGGRTVSLRKPEMRQQFIIHRHRISDEDFLQAEGAEAIHGVGIRHVLYWWDWLKREWVSNISDWAERAGLGLRLWYFEANNPKSKEAVQEAAEDNARRVNILVPRYEGQKQEAVEYLDVATGGPELLLKLIQHIEEFQERYVIGQTLSSGTEGGGLGGSGVASLHADCVPVETSEILTRSGFKSPSEVQIGEEVLAYDVDADCCRWTPLLAKKFYDDAAVTRMSVSRKKFDVVCTPDHSWAVAKKNTVGKTRALTRRSPVTIGPRGGINSNTQTRRLAKANEMAPTERIILAAPEIGTTESLLTPTEAAVLGWAVTDGTIQWRGSYVRVGICQSKERFFTPIREMILAATGEIKESVFHTPERTFPMNGKTYQTKPQHWWYLPVAVGRSLLAKCGFKSRADLPGIVTRLDAESRQAMLEAMMMAEGDDRKVFANTDPHIMEAFEILCALEGFATGMPNVRKDSFVNGVACKTIICKRLKKPRHIDNKYIQREDAGKTTVWCPTTAYGTWVMRQNGMVMITGNTKSKIIAFDANNLGETLTHQWVRVIQRWTLPRTFDRIFPRWVFDIDEPDSDKKLDAVTKATQIGVTFVADEIRGLTGLSAPRPGDVVVGGQPPGGPGGAPGQPPGASGGPQQPGPQGPPAGQPGAAQGDPRLQALYRQMLSGKGDRAQILKQAQALGAQQQPRGQKGVQPKQYGKDVSGEARDEGGKWTDGSGGGVSEPKKEMPKLSKKETAKALAKAQAIQRYYQADSPNWKEQQDIIDRLSAPPGVATKPNRNFSSSNISGVLYTGTNEDFGDSFSDHTYLTPDPKVAASYGQKVRAVKVDAKKVFEPKTLEDIENLTGIKREPDAANVFDELDRPKVRDAIKAKGFHAVRFTDVAPNSDGNDEHDAVIVFDGKRLSRQTSVNYEADKGSTSSTAEVGNPLHYGQDDWKQQTGDRGGHKWVNVHSGEEVYAQDNPGGADRPAAQQDQPGQRQAAAQTPQAALQHGQDVLSGKAAPSVAGLQALAAALEQQSNDEEDEWDGEIDQAGVAPNMKTPSEELGQWDEYDSEGALQRHPVRLQHGSYKPNPKGPADSAVPVFRWAALHHVGGVQETGDWTTDKEEAVKDGKEQISINHEEPPEWDGSIDQLEVKLKEGAKKLDTWSVYDETGNETESTVQLQKGTYATSSGPVDVYRWQSVGADGTEDDAGEWTADKAEAVTDGKGHVEENHQDAPEWDGEVDQDAVQPVEGARKIGKWSTYSATGAATDNAIQLQSGTYHPYPDLKGSKPVKVYRWQSVGPDGAEQEGGEWTDDKDAAAQDGAEHAKDNQEEEPEWDGEIDGDAVEAEEGGKKITTWSVYDETGAETTETMQVQVGTYHPLPELKGSKPVKVYRFQSMSAAGEETYGGDWTADKEEALADGKAGAEENQGEAPEWDGDIDADAVQVGDAAREVGKYSSYDADGKESVSKVHVQSGAYHPFPNLKGSKPVKVFRWRSVGPDGAQTYAGDWTQDKEEATSDGKDDAEGNHEEAPEQEEDETEETDETGGANRADGEVDPPAHYEEKFDEGKHPRGHTGNPGQFTSKGQGVASGKKPQGDKKDKPKVVTQSDKRPTAKQPPAEDAKKPAWDGTIDEDNVDRDRRGHDHIQSWNFWDGSDGPYENNVRLVHGLYTHDPDDEDSDPVDVWRWESGDDNGTTDSGDWTAAEDEAREAGEAFASKSDQEPKWDGEIDQGEVERRRSGDEDIAAFTDEDGVEHSVVLQQGSYDPFPNWSGSEPVTVYRYMTHDSDGDIVRGGSGEWVTDEAEAQGAGAAYAEESNVAGIDSDDIEESEDEPPPPPLKKKGAPGKSKALVKVQAKDVGVVLAKLFPQHVENPAAMQEALASIVGAPDDAEVTVTHAGKYVKAYADDPDMNATGVRVSIKHGKLENAKRFIGVDASGARFIKNEILVIKEEHQGGGLGLDIFSRQVENAADEGFNFISTHAAGGPGESMNGYYTWPRFGYNESLKSIAKHNPKLARKILAEYPDARSVQDLFADAEGREWWKANGGDLYDARFDLGEQSWSRYRLEAYMEERASKKGKGK